MIKGAPQVSERDGTRVLMDENGDEVVVRRRTPHRQCTFHQVDIERFAEGEIRPACNAQGQRESGSWDLGRREDLDAIWDECERSGCWGGGSSDDLSASREYQTLAGQLRAISSEEDDWDDIDLSQFTPNADDDSAE